MFFTFGVILTAVGASLCLLAIAITWKLLRAGPAPRASKPVSPATSEDKAPSTWESRLAEVRADVASLSVSFEKVATQVSRLNKRIAQRDRRDPADQDELEVDEKTATLRSLGLAGKVGGAFHQRAQEIDRARSNR